MSKSGKDILRGVLRSLSASIPTTVNSSTVPIVKSHWPALRQLGTGTLFKIADRHFVVTAGHVLEDAAKNDATLAIAEVTVVLSWLAADG
jgi:hypothetical protein